jgi:hypothetical protein
MKFVMLFCSLVSVASIASDRALQISVNSVRTEDQLDKVNYVVQAIVARMVSDDSVSKVTRPLSPGEGKIGYEYCLELSPFANDNGLANLEAIFNTISLPELSAVTYQVNRVAKCP